MGIFSSLNSEQKEAFGLLQVGTFLEYFDFMIYIHMAVLLNELFFPRTDPHSAGLLAAFAFCSTYIMRPVGALIFGYIGDNIGRKTTVIFSTMMMAFSCVIMANLPTYDEIGITAAWAVTLCRIIQGLSSQGEIIGVEVYLTEISKPPARYPLVSLASFSSSLGGMLALALAVLLTVCDINWRIAFWFGAVIALVGTSARTRIRETPEFVDLKRRMRQAIESSKKEELGKVAELLKSASPVWKEKVNKKTASAYFLISCGFPICFYFSYIYLGHVLKVTFNYTPPQIIYQNFFLSIFHVISFFTYAILSYRIHPLKLLKFRLFMFSAFVLMCPYLLYHVSTPKELFVIQCFVMCFGIMDVPGAGIFIAHFPVFKRFTTTSLLYAFSRIIVYLITSFGFVYLAKYFNYWGISFMFLVVTVGFGWGVYHFCSLENDIDVAFSKTCLGHRYAK